MEEWNAERKNEVETTKEIETTKTEGQVTSEKKLLRWCWWLLC